MSMWEHTGKKRPDYAEQPSAGQESVWDYPRPPTLVMSDERVEVSDASVPIATSVAALRVLETASPPTYYLPKKDIDWRQLVKISQSSFCEWKGEASYYALASDPQQVPIAWLYANPSNSFAAIHDHASFYPGRVECRVNSERVRPQPGEFYGGWITDGVRGPFKGEPGTGHW